jgi:hypothetical protein
MALPEQVINQLGKEPAGTPGWAYGAIFFSGGILLLAIVTYLGITFGYDPYLQSQISNTQNEVTKLNASISPTDQANLINFYSQISNLQTLLKNHVLSSQFFSWLEKNTESNVYYQSFALTAGDKVTITGGAANEADINQQIAIFENSPEVKTVSVSSVSAAPTVGGWNFTVSLVLNSSLFLSSNP